MHNKRSLRACKTLDTRAYSTLTARHRKPPKRGFCIKHQALTNTSYTYKPTSSSVTPLGVTEEAVHTQSSAPGRSCRIDEGMTAAVIDRFSGFAEQYDLVRPAPPDVVADVLCEIAATRTPELVIDVGSGTGLSTRPWSHRAKRVVGIEPNDDMREQARRTTEAGNVSYVSASANQTGQPDASADIVTCVQALHWMEPTTTFAEVHRCLRDGGVFAAIDCDWPPFVHWELDAEWRRLHELADELVASRGLSPGLEHWEKEGHLARMRSSGRFRSVTELAFHHRIEADAPRVVMLAKTQGGLATALKAGLPEAHAALESFAYWSEKLLGGGRSWWTYIYRVRVGIK